jgi:hypothetical protein
MGVFCLRRTRADPHRLVELVIGPATSGRTRCLATSPFQGENFCS